MKKTLTLLAAWLVACAALHAQWNNIAPDGSNFYKIKMTSANTGYVSRNAGSGPVGLSKTIDGGVTWNAVPFNSILYIRDFHFLDDNTGFICADTATGTFPYSMSLYKTVDGGNTWTTVHTFAGAVPVEANVYFTDALHGIVTETYSRIWITSDGGVTWTSQDFGYAYFQDIDFPSASVGYITCADGTFSYFGLVLKTTDGGATWSEVFDFGDIPLNYTTAGAVDFIDETTGYMETMENFYKTTDGGLTWDSLPYAHNNDITLQDIVFTSVVTGYGCDAMGGIFKTTDGGLTWTIDRAQDGVTWFRSMDINGGNAYAAGSGGQLLKKTGISALRENNPEQLLKIYPNPSAGLFYLQQTGEQRLNINVYSLTGETVFTVNDYAGHVLDLSALGNGCYLVEYGTGNGAVSSQRINILK